MNKLIAAAVATAFALGTVSTFAADAAKKDELTTEQRSELRDRAERMKMERANGPQVAQKAAPKTVHKTTHKKKAHKKAHKKVQKTTP